MVNWFIRADGNIELTYSLRRVFSWFCSVYWTKLTKYNRIIIFSAQKFRRKPKQEGYWRIISAFSRLLPNNETFHCQYGQDTDLGHFLKVLESTPLMLLLEQYEDFYKFQIKHSIHAKTKRFPLDLVVIFFSTELGFGPTIIFCFSGL